MMNKTRNQIGFRISFLSLREEKTLRNDEKDKWDTGFPPTPRLRRTGRRHDEKNKWDPRLRGDDGALYGGIQ
jgi:hypothetical protein